MKRLLLIVLSSLTVPVLALAHSGGDFEGGWGHHMGMGGFYGGGWIMMAAVTILVILAITVIGKWIFVKRDMPQSNAQTILLDRFAKGEIDEETFARMRKSLK